MRNLALETFRLILGINKIFTTHNRLRRKFKTS